MKKKRTYRTITIQDVDINALLALFATKVLIAIDIAKEAMVAGFADATGQTALLVRFSHPTQTRLLIEVAVALRDAGRSVEIAMEPTGVYGEALRHQFITRNFVVFRVDPKRAHDAALILDGVPSQHDPKACTLIAFLHAQGISALWRERSALEHHARALVDEHAIITRPLEHMQGRLEAATVMYWPELNTMISRRTSWYLHLLSEWPTPAHVAEDANAVRDLLRRKTFNKLSAEQIEKVIELSRDSLGMPATQQQAELVRTIAREALDCRTRLKAVEDRMRKLCDQNDPCARVATAIGPAAAVAIFADLGDPTAYASAAAFVKACGLNLRERSSGTHQGRLHITKRGPARVRRYLFLAAMRMIIASPVVRRWYERRGAYREGVKHKAIVAIMRKLARAMVHVARGSAFDINKLFDVRRLDLTATHETSSAVATT